MGGRSLKKGPFVDEHLMKKVRLKLTTKRKSYQNLGRRSTIFPSFISYTITYFMMDVNVPVYIKKTW